MDKTQKQEDWLCDSDMLLTEKYEGRRMMVDAFSIAAALEEEKSTKLILKDVAVTNGAGYNVYKPVLEVQENFDEVMKKRYLAMQPKK